MKFVMKKKILFILLLLVVCLLPTHAVLKEANLDTTLFMLRTELTQYHIDLEKQNRMAKAQQQAVIKELIHIMMQADQNSIMLYSQRNGYIFDLTYACNEATEQFRKFKSKAAPFRNMINQNNIEVARFDSLINYLYGMNTMFLSEEAQVNRNVDLTLAVNIRRQLVEKQKQLQAYVQAYDRTDRKLQALNDYANRSWAGLNTGYYDRRWQLYFEEAFIAVEQGRDFDQQEYDSKAGEFEHEWVARLSTAPHCPNTNTSAMQCTNRDYTNAHTDVLTLSRLIQAKYFNK